MGGNGPRVGDAPGAAGGGVPGAVPNAERGERLFPCQQCGASLRFEPGSDKLTCPYCGAANTIGATRDGVLELDYGEALQRLAEHRPSDTVSIVKCQSCAAEVTPPPNVTSFPCAFCGVNIVAQSRQCAVIRPNAVLPFKVTGAQARDSFKKWVKSRWFAPNKLRIQNLHDGAVQGIYMPAWTFDAKTTTRYTGQRGEAYYVMVGSGKNRRMERRVRWYPASGVVQVPFDDVLVPASKTLDQRKVEDLTPWDLKACVEYREEYLAGFTAERYTVDLPAGFADAQTRMSPVIDQAIRRDIGGDEQRIHSKQTRCDDVTFKHILLPIWLSSYRFKNRVYRFMVNARTGEIAGDRPYSWVKITLAIVAGLIVLGLLAVAFAGARGNA